MEEIFMVFVLKCFYFMLPAYIANMAPVIVRKINILSMPIDLNLYINNKPIFGKNKTFRGFIFGIVLAIFATFLQYLLYDIELFNKLSFFDYENWLLFGFLIGSGTLVGDLVKSFFKRRLGIPPGAKFVPFDQIDFVFGALIFITPIFNINFNIFLTSLLLSFVLHIIINHIAFYLKIRNEKW